LAPLHQPAAPSGRSNQPILHPAAKSNLRPHRLIQLPNRWTVRRPIARIPSLCLTGVAVTAQFRAHPKSLLCSPALRCAPAPFQRWGSQMECSDPTLPIAHRAPSWLHPGPVGPHAVESRRPWPAAITPTGGLFLKCSAPVCYIAALDTASCSFRAPPRSASSPRLRLQPLFDGAAACIGMGDLLGTRLQSCALTGRPSIPGMHGLHLLTMAALV
jgi:hypothetical protein